MTASWLPRWPRCSWVRIETGTSARSSSPSVRVPRERSHFCRPPETTVEHDVVDRAAERVLDELEVLELLAQEHEAPVRPDLDVERRLGRGVERRPRDLADALDRLAGRLERLGRPARRGGGAARELERRAHQPADAAGGEVERGRLGVRTPRLALVGELRAAPARRRTARSRGRRPRSRRPARGGSWRSARSGCPRAPARATSPTAAWRGRAAASGCARRAMRSCSSEPGDGSAVWRTWYSRLKLGSSIHTGRPVSIGGNASFWR